MFCISAEASESILVLKRTRSFVYGIHDGVYCSTFTHDYGVIGIEFFMDDNIVPLMSLRLIITCLTKLVISI